MAPTTLRLQAAGQEVGVQCTFGDTGARCTPASGLPEGPITLTGTITDYAGNLSEPATVDFTIDTIPPRITVTAPLDGTLTNQAQQSLSGYLSETATLTLNGQAVGVRSDHTVADDLARARHGVFGGRQRAAGYADQPATDAHLHARGGFQCR